MFLKEVDPGEVLFILQKLNDKKSADIFKISPKLVKICATELHVKLTCLFNLSFKTGKFPSNLKIANVIPIFNSGSKMECGNYRPISLLPIFGKFFEKIMHSRIYSFIESQNILIKSQYGFQKGKSTEQALVDIQSKIVNSFENKEIPCCIFLDFAKAFDTVNHKILIDKLYYYGIRGSPLDWITSYLTNRSQCVTINNHTSSKLPITCGVPQGSILGPMLFLLYINDIVSSASKVDFQLFADDTCIFFSHKDKQILENTLNSELALIHDWLVANKLSLNVSKSNLLTFRNKNSTEGPMITLKINNEIVAEKAYAKYLGIIFDNKLTWHFHIEHIALKLTKSNGLIAKLRHFISLDKLKLIYNALIQPHLDYGSLSWSSASDSQLNRLTKLQNKTVKLMSFKKRFHSPTPLFLDIKVLPLKQSIMLNQIKFIWKILHHKFPICIEEIFSNNNINLSNRDPESLKLNLPFKITSFGTSFLLFSGIKTWNSIPPNIRLSKSLFSLKRNLKPFLLSKIVL